MSELYPTKTRLDLLRTVNAGDVMEGLTEDTQGHTWLTSYTDPARKVCARIAEAEAAGWVELNEPNPVWALTDAGRAVLDAHGGQR